jgi:hypothetical protein
MNGEIILDMLAAFRDAVMAESTVAGLLETWQGEPAVFTRRPLPADAPDLCVLINPAAATTDADGLTSRRPIVTHDIAIYGRKGMPGSAEDQTRAVERIAGLLQLHFHRNRFSVQPDGFSVIGVRVGGPMPAPVDDEQTVGRIISVTVRLRRA